MTIGELYLYRMTRIIEENRDYIYRDKSIDSLCLFVLERVN